MNLLRVRVNESNVTTVLGMLEDLEYAKPIVSCVNGFHLHGMTILLFKNLSISFSLYM